MKKNRAISLFLCLCLLLQVFVFTGFAQEAEADESVINGSHSIDAQKSLLGSGQLITNSESVLLYDMNSQTMIYAFNPDLRYSPASLVKIMTCWVAVENGNLEDQVTVNGALISGLENDTVKIGLKDGEVVTVKDLLYCMMVGSANDATIILANHICGNERTFVSLMNEYAQRAGCQDTNFTNCSGYHDEMQYTTARDLAKIIDMALENGTFKEIFGADYYAVEATNLSEKRHISTNNYLMNVDSFDVYYDSRVTGGRSGITSTDMGCVAVTAKKGNLEVISILLGASSAYEENGYTIKSYGGFPETSDLLDIGLTGYRRTQIIADGQVFMQCPVVNGESDVVLGTNISVSTVLPEAVDESDLVFRYFDVDSEFRAPIEKGTKLSYVEIWYQGICLATADLYAMNAVPVMYEKLYEPTPPNWLDVVLSVLWKVILFAAGVFVIYLIAVRVFGRFRKVSARNRARRNRMNRRRSR